MENSTEKEVLNNLSSLKETMTNMSNQCLNIQQELSTILTKISLTQEAKDENGKQTDRYEMSTTLKIVED